MLPINSKTAIFYNICIINKIKTMQTSKTLSIPAQSLNNFLDTQRFGKSTIYFKGIVCQSLDDFKQTSKAGEFYTHFTGEVYINVKIGKTFILQVIEGEFKTV